MSKKRVHELAKELGLENREAVLALQSAGISVKTHSSSVYEEEALAVLNKIKEPAPAAPARRPGMMIVKKRRDSEVDAAAGDEAPPEAAVEAPEPAAPAVAAPPPAAEPVAAAPGEPAPPPSAAPEAAAASAPPPEAAAAPPPPSIAERPQVRTAADTVSGRRPEVESVRRQESSNPGAPPPPAAKMPPRPTVRPGSAPAATVVRMIDRDKLLERVPGRRLGGGARPGGAGGAGGQRFGQVTELKVVTDPFGRGREMITVGRDKKAKGPAGVGAGPGARGAPPNRRGRPGGRREMSDMRERALHPARLKKKKANKRLPGKQVISQPKASKRVIRMKETIVVADLAHQLGVKSVDILRKLMALGTMVTQNQSIDFEAAQLMAAEFEYTVESVAFTENIHIDEVDEAADAADAAPRPPVVTVMGHVDHGKTSLLDAIRKARVVDGEAGGITQHIGAYSVPVPGKGSVTFLDTPGHAAFTEMRARGAQVTDIVILVVAADDGVMPQTEEAIRHAQAAKVPIIVAVNKIDRPEANADRVMQELTKFELLPEAWGGETLYINTSATKGTGIAELLEAVLLQAEVLELRANPERPAIGVVVEAQLDRGRGPVATVLVQQGTLKRGDSIVVGVSHGKIRAMVDDQGKQIAAAGPSAAVEVTGLDSVPAAGDALNTVETPEAARAVAEHRMGAKRGQEQAAGAAVSLDDLMKRMAGSGGLELKVVLKADVQGSVEAVKGALLKLSTEEVKVNVIYGGVGAIKESDIMLAAASQGLVLGFGVRPDSGARATADREGVEIRTYSIIYEAIDDITKAMEGLLKPEAREKVVGRAEVRELFRVSKVGVIGGCRVTEGKASRAARVRVLRDSVQVYEGKVSSLRHFKNDAREVDAGLECGVGVEGFNDLKNGDIVEFFQIEEIARTLSQPSANTRRAGGGGAEAHP